MTSLEPLAFNSLEKDALIHVVGVTGVEGAAVVSFLLQEGFTNIVGHAMCEKVAFERELLKSHDLKDPKEKQAVLEQARSWGVDIHFSDSYLKGIEEAVLIFAPQSWELYPEENATLFSLRSKLRNIIHLYLGLAPCTTVGVTGSDGKTTTTHLITHLLREEGHKVWLSGNYRQGTHVLSQIRDLDPDGYLVLEISNRHLNFGLAFYPDVTVITNVTQNHLTEYKSFDEYVHVKERILGPESIVVLNADNPYTLHMGDHCKERLLFSRSRTQDMTGATMVGDEIKMNGVTLASLDDVCLPGSHNLENILAAVTVAHRAHVSPEAIMRGLNSFCTVPERLELILELNGRKLINDLSATSAESTRRGILSFEDLPISVVLGGDTKGVHYEPLARSIQDRGAKIFGIKSDVTESLKEHGVDVHEFGDVQTAVFEAYKNTPEGGVVLISPAGAYFSSRYLLRGIGAVISSLRSHVLLEDQET